jgi:prophage regulatory protein
MSKHSLTGWLRVWQIVGDKKRDAPAIIPMSAQTVWRLSREGKFPEPYTLSPGVTAWKGEDVQAWIDSRPQRQRG